MIWHSGGDVMWNGARLQAWQAEFLDDLWADECRAAFQANDWLNAARILVLRDELNAALTAAINWKKCS